MVRRRSLSCSNPRVRCNLASLPSGSGLQWTHKCLSACMYRCYMEEAVRWNVKVSKEIDLTLRTYLGAQGMKKGDLSKFIEEAVRWRIFNRTVQTINSRHANADTNELQAIVDRAVREVRSERRIKRKANKA